MTQISVSVLGLLLCLLPLARCDGGAVQLQSVRRSGGYMIPLKQREHSGWRRHLLRRGSMPVYGSVRELGYFYATLHLGTPSRTFSLIIDTGSTITYIPCKGCPRCGKHQSVFFDPEESSTARRLECNDPLCNCGHPSCSCAASNQCYYRRSYAEGSSSEGFLLTDVMTFPDNQPPVNVVFGCVNGETGELYRQMADGLVGMGNSANAFHSQLVSNGVIDDVFSLCFGHPRDGLLLLGDVSMPPGVSTIYTPLLSNLRLHYYNVQLDGIFVGDERLPLDESTFERGYGVVLDSGTTFTYLPTVAFEAMSKAVGDAAKQSGLERTPGADPQYNDICWKGAKDHFEDLERFFPHAVFEFGGGAKLQLPPLRYLFRSRPAEYCLSFFDNGGSGTLIGTGSVLDVVVTYDRRNGRVGFTDMRCSEMAAALAARNVSAFSPPPKEGSKTSQEHKNSGHMLKGSGDKHMKHKWRV